MTEYSLYQLEAIYDSLKTLEKLRAEFEKHHWVDFKTSSGESLAMGYIYDDFKVWVDTEYRKIKSLFDGIKIDISEVEQ